jgi:hypothetical protein
VVSRRSATGNHQHRTLPDATAHPKGEAMVRKDGKRASAGMRPVTLPPGTILRTQMVGQWVCHFGRKTGQSCGVIDTIRYRPPPNFCNNTTCSDRWPAIISDPNIACYGGDSGGPYWSGNIAYGMHTGGSHTGTEAGQCPLAILMSVEQLSWDGVNTRVMVAN